MRDPRTAVRYGYGAFRVPVSASTYRREQPRSLSSLAGPVTGMGAACLLLVALLPLAQREPVDLDFYLHGPRPSEPGEIEVLIADVVFRRDLYPRSQLRLDIVARYKEFLPDLPPIEINQHNELIDGWHRIEAHKKASVAKIRAVVTEVENDIEHLKTACLRNSRHGEQLPISVERKARGYSVWPLQRPRDLAVGAA